MRKTMMSVLLVAALVVMGAFVAAADPPRREWPASERDKLALETLNRAGAELAQARKQLDEAESRLRARYDAVAAEIRSSCSGMDARSQVGYDEKRGVFFEVAPITTEMAKN